MAIDLKDNTVPDEELAEDLKGDVAPAPKADETKPEDQTETVPYHKDPNVQAYIERQVAKRVGEGNQAWEDRLTRLESNLRQPAQPETPKIGDWEPAGDAEAKAARAIIAQAKQEMLDDLKQQDQAQKQEQEQNDRAFVDWLDELKTTSVLTDADSQDFAQMIVKYKLDDKQAAVELWNTLKAEIQQARDEGATEGEIKGIKKAQEAKIGSARKGNEPGQTGRSFKQRRAEEPNFSSILDRELSRMGK
jgi:hypothetical protein